MMDSDHGHSSGSSSRITARRILVIGCSGSGKSTLSRKLASATGLPVIHLDQYYFSPNWKEPSQEDWTETLAALIAEDDWIMDGSYTGSLAQRAERADLIIYLKLPTWICLSRVVRRTLLYHGSVRADAAEGCRERFNWDFTKYVLHYQQKIGPRIERVLAAYRASGGEVVTLHTHSEVTRFVDGLVS